MTHEQYEALLAYLDARIAEKIADAFGRDSLHEIIRCNAFEADLRKLLVTEDEV